MKRRDDVSLWPWPLTLEVMAPVAHASRRPPSVHQVWSSWAWPFGRYGTRCRSTLMGLVTDLWPFYHETDYAMLIYGGKVPSKFGHARPSDCRIICYVRDGQTDRQIDGQKQRLSPPSLRGRGHNKVWGLIIWWMKNCECLRKHNFCIRSL